jgi:hypothetical protein
MAWDMVLLREPQAQPPCICRLTPLVLGNLERRTDSTRAPPSRCPDEQDQSLEGERLDKSMHGRPLVGPPCPTVEETSPSRLGVLRSPRPNSGDPRKYNSRAPSKSPRRDISRHFILADRRTCALLPYRSRKGPGKAP